MTGPPGNGAKLAGEYRAEHQVSEVRGQESKVRGRESALDNIYHKNITNYTSQQFNSCPVILWYSLTPDP